MENFFEYYDENKNKFEWFIKKYFPHKLEQLEQFREEEDKEAIISILNEVWFLLPSNEFNVLKNPKGWEEFLNLIEE